MRGASYLAVPIQAFPQVPDITVAEHMPGGILLPAAPGPGGPPVTTINRNQYRLQFPVQQGNELTLRRIHIKSPVFLAELSIETVITTGEAETLFFNEEEAKQAFEGKGGRASFVLTTAGIGPTTRYEKVKTVHGYELRGVPKRELIQLNETRTERSVLPITVTVVARLIGPDGELWSDSFEVPLSYVLGGAGSAVGTGTLDAYADLTNPISISPEKPHSLALLVFIPAAVATNTALGFAVKNGSVINEPGEVTLFYDVEAVPVGK